MKFTERLKAGVLLDNPVFMQTIGLCPALATTTSLSNAIGMGAAATVVLICSNVVISLLRKFIPDKIRIAAFISIIATFVTLIQMLLNGLGFTFALVLMGFFRELLGAGTIAAGIIGDKGIQIPGLVDYPATMMILPAGGFLVMGFILAAIQKIMSGKEGK